MKTKLKLPILMLYSSIGLTAFAQQADKTHTTNSGKKEESIKKPASELSVLFEEFKELANFRIKDNEKSAEILKSMNRIRDPEALKYYNENVALFEKRNGEMKNRIVDFDINKATKLQFDEFKKRWHWAMDEISVFEKNLMTENFLNK